MSSLSPSSSLRSLYFCTGLFVSGLLQCVFVNMLSAMRVVLQQLRRV